MEDNKTLADTKRGDTVQTKEGASNNKWLTFLRECSKEYQRLQREEQRQQHEEVIASTQALEQKQQQQ